MRLSALGGSLGRSLGRPSQGRRLVAGIVSGAAGTVALDLLTNHDMQIRGRPASEVPAKVVGRLAEDVGAGGLVDPSSGEQASSRRSALGALSGYLVGLGLGAAYGLTDARRAVGSVALAAPLLGGAAMAASDVPAVATGATDPASWGAMGWAADVIPHLAYGAVTAFTYELLTA
jgi:hypothetical protein